jgi:hypothetical protein
MIDLLQWLAERPRTYAETIGVWKSSCPRLAHWEDAVADGLVRVEHRHVHLTEAGKARLSARPCPATTLPDMAAASVATSAGAPARSARASAR